MSRLNGIQIQEVISETAVWLPRRQTKTQRRNVQGLKRISDRINFSKNMGKRLLAFLLHVLEKLSVRSENCRQKSASGKATRKSLCNYHKESDLNEPPGRSQVSTEEKYDHVQPNLVKKKIPGKITDDKRTHYEHLFKL